MLALGQDLRMLTWLQARQSSLHHFHLYMADTAAEVNPWSLLSLSSQDKDSAERAEELRMFESASDDPCKVQAHTQKAPEAGAAATGFVADSVYLQADQHGGKGMMPAAACQTGDLHIPAGPRLDAEAAQECLPAPNSRKHPLASAVAHEPAQVPSSAVFGSGGDVQPSSHLPSAQLPSSAVLGSGENVQPSFNMPPAQVPSSAVLGPGHHGQPSSNLPSPSQKRQHAVKTQEGAHVAPQANPNAATSEDGRAQDRLPPRPTSANSDEAVQKHMRHNAEDHLTATFNAAKRTNVALRVRLEDSKICIDAS